MEDRESSSFSRPVQNKCLQALRRFASEMSLLKWLGKANPGLVGQYPKPKTPGLPDPNREETDAEAQLVTSANAAVEETRELGDANGKRKRGPYHSYDGNLRLKMARSIDNVGLAETAGKFTVELGHDVSMNTLKSIQKKIP